MKVWIAILLSFSAGVVWAQAPATQPAATSRPSTGPASQPTARPVTMADLIAASYAYLHGPRARRTVVGREIILSGKVVEETADGTIVVELQWESPATVQDPVAGSPSRRPETGPAPRINLTFSTFDGNLAALHLGTPMKIWGRLDSVEPSTVRPGVAGKEQIALRITIMSADANAP